MKEFKNRVAVITGAASGIGLAMAERFATEGMNLVLADFDEEPLIAAGKAFEAKGVPTLAVLTDVSKAADIERLARRALDRFGSIHIVCNNAGIGPMPAFSWELPLDEWKRVIDINLWGVIHGIRTFVPILLEQKADGYVVNTASGAGLLALPFHSEYHASKFAVVGLTESLYYELELMRSKVKVALLCPGVVRTGIARDRNRPGVPRVDETQVSKQARQWLQSCVQLNKAAAKPPVVVAECVLQAIREERFYVFPQPEILEPVRARMEALITGSRPAPV